MSRKSYFFVGMVLAFFVFTVKCSNDDEGGNERKEMEPNLGAYVIRNIVHGNKYLRKNIINGLLGKQTGEEENADIEKSDSEEEEEEEEENSGSLRSLFNLLQLKNKEDEASVSDIQEEPINSTHVDAIVDALQTAKGVDPTDPEEIARKKYYSEHKETFSEILGINTHVNATDLNEGDMKQSFGLYRNAGGNKWPKTRHGAHRGLVRIPYKMSSKYNATHRRTIRSAMEQYAKYTCIRFVPRTSESSYIFVSDGRGCWAYVGRTGYSAQTVSLGVPGCVSKGIAMHELMHALGFHHEHSRSDRENYVRVLTQNLNSDMNLNFERHDHTRNLVVYDYGSVMHYSKHAFSKQPYLPSMEIVPRRNPEPLIGQRSRLSPYDIEEIKYLYDCGVGSFPRCGRDFNNQRGGSFQSPNYPRAYPKEAHCTWRITVPKGGYVEVTFTNVDITDSPECQDDGILIHNGVNAAAPILRKICGKQRGDIVVRSTGNTIFVIFSSDHMRESNTGFRATFRRSNTRGSLPPRLTMPTLAPITKTISRFSCNFENGNDCGMTQDTLDQQDWLRLSGPTPSRDTGPPGDHTTGRGEYMYVESSLPAEAGDNSIIRTSWFRRSNRFCVSFSYHMYGNYMGALRVYALEKRRRSRKGHEVLLWEKHGNQGNRWYTKKINYTPRGDVEHVHFYWEAYVFFYQSDIAIDDLEVTPGSCSSRLTTTTPPRVAAWTTNKKPRTPTPLPATAVPSTTTTKRTTTTAPPVYSNITCDFDESLCGFTQSRTDNFDWTRRSGSTPSASTGPTSDHTSGTGHYMYIEASSPRRFGQVAQLRSPLLTLQRHCLNIWYHMYGKQTGKLTISQVISGRSTVLKELMGNKGNEWFNMKVEVNSPDMTSTRRDYETSRPFIPSEVEVDVDFEKNWIEEGINSSTSEIRLSSPLLAHDNSRPGATLTQTGNHLQIVISASIDKGYAGDIAVDDIVITDDACENAVTSVPSTMLKEFSCDFESSSVLCGLSQAQDDDFDWAPNAGSTGSSGTGPSTDHTKKTETGTYLYIESSSPRRVNDVAELVTPKFTPGAYCVRFASHMYGSAVGELKVLSMEENTKGALGTPIQQWSKSGNQGNVWQTHEILFTSKVNSRAVQFIFRGMIGTSFTSDIAIDDIDISKGRCSQSATRTPVVTTTSRRARPATSTIGIRPVPTVHRTRPNTTPRTTTRLTTTTRRPRPTTTTRRTTTTTTTKPTTTRRTRPTTTTVTTRRTTTKRTTTTRRPTTTTTTTTKPATTTTPPPTTTTRPVISSTLPRDFACNFEAGVLCGMNQLRDDNFDWIRRNGKTPSGGTGPVGDHTTDQGGQGNYIYIEASSPHQRGYVAKLVTPNLALETPKRCVVFWYHMWGNGMGSLQVYADIVPALRLKKSSQTLQPVSNVIQTFTGNQGQQWQMARIEVNQDPDYYGGKVQFRFQGERGRTFQSDMALDDICITEGPCDASSKCTAEGILRRTTPVPPVSKHTRRPLLRIRPTTTTTTTTPKIITTTTTPKPTPITTSKSTTTTRRPTTSTRPRIVTTRKTTPAPTVSRGPPAWAGMPLCTFESGRRARRPGRRPSAIPGDSSKDMGNYLYPNYLNNPMCGWRQFTKGQDQFDWTRHTGPTKSKGTGPSGDKTSGRGHYMYIEASAPRKLNDIALLQTYLMPVADYCIDMNYHMFGAYIGRLSVRALQKLNNGRYLLSNLHNIAGNKQDMWRNAKIDYTPRQNTAAVAFRLEGSIGRDYRGDIAVDDITILAGRCDACKTPSHRFVNSLKQVQKFTTGCINSNLFWVRCCSISQPKAVYRRVKQCNPNMFSAVRLNWYCQFL